MNQREVGAKKEEQAGEYLKSCGYELEAKKLLLSVWRD